VVTYERPREVLRTGPWLVTDAGHRLAEEVAA
jgi:hypothetical protein